MNSNRLFATFFPKENIDDMIQEISSRYNILYNKIFILSIKDSDEKVCTYNTDNQNMGLVIENTIMVHRKKVSNTLYSLNALNELVKRLNNGILDEKFIVNWEDYKNTLLLTKNGELKKLETSLYKIINIL